MHTLKGHGHSDAFKWNRKHLTLGFLCVFQVSHYTGPGDLGASWTGNSQEQKQVCSLQRLRSDMAAEGTYTINIHFHQRQRKIQFMFFIFCRSSAVLIFSPPFSLCIVPLPLPVFLPFSPSSRTAWVATVAQQWLQLWVQLQTTMRRRYRRCAMQTEQRASLTMLLLMKTPTLASSGSLERK